MAGCSSALETSRRSSYDVYERPLVGWECYHVSPFDALHEERQDLVSHSEEDLEVGQGERAHALVSGRKMTKVHAAGDGPLLHA